MILFMIHVHLSIVKVFWSFWGILLCLFGAFSHFVAYCFVFLFLLITSKKKGLALGWKFCRTCAIIQRYNDHEKHGDYLGSNEGCAPDAMRYLKARKSG